jgi:hypothetical protein
VKTNLKPPQDIASLLWSLQMSYLTPRPYLGDQPEIASAAYLGLARAYFSNPWLPQTFAPFWILYPPLSLTARLG